MNCLKLFKKIHILVYIIALIIIDLILKFTFISKNICGRCFFYIQGRYQFGTIFGSFPEIYYFPLLIFIFSGIFVIIMVAKRDSFLNNKYLVWCYMFMISGVSGNALDRFLLGAVRDFIGIKYYAVFNIADVYILLGIIMYGIFYFSHFTIHHKKGVVHRKKKKS